MALTKVTGSVIKDSVSLSGNVSVGGTLTYQDVTNVDALGIGTFRAGIDITGGNLIIPDKIIHSGDTNTAIRFPAADTITAETNGTEKLRIASDGNMGLGTNSLVGNAANVYLTVNGSNLGGIALKANGTNQGYLQGTSSLIRLSSDGSKPITFDTNGSERLRIDAGGGLQLGTSTATASKLTVYGANDAAAIFQGSGTGTGAGNGLLVGNNGGTTGLLWNYENGNTLFATNNIERLRIDSSGNILTSGNTQLIGSNTSDGSDNKAIMMNGGGAVSDSRGGYVLVHGNEHSSFPGVTRLHAGNVGTAYIVFNTAGSERLRINSSGQLIMTNAATQTFFDFSTTNNTTRGLFSVAGKDGSGNAVTVKIGGFGDTNRGEIFTHSNHSLGFATNNASAQVILHTSGLFDVVGECRATNFYLRGNGSAPTADASIFRPADNTLAFATASTERIRIENSGISGTIKNNYALVAFITDRDDGSRSTGSTSYQDDTGLNLTNAITYKHGDILFVKANCPTGVALVSSNTANYQGVGVRIKLTPSSGTTRYSNETRGWYRNDGPATKETMQMSTTIYHLIASNTSEFSDNVTLSFQVQYKRDPGGTGSYGAVGLSNWSGERTLEVWQFRKQL